MVTYYIKNVIYSFISLKFSESRATFTIVENEVVGTHGCGEFFSRFFGSSTLLNKLEGKHTLSAKMELFLERFHEEIYA